MHMGYRHTFKSKTHTHKIKYTYFNGNNQSAFRQVSRVLLSAPVARLSHAHVFPSLLNYFPRCRVRNVFGFGFSIKKKLARSPRANIP